MCACVCEREVGWVCVYVSVCQREVSVCVGEVGCVYVSLIFVVCGMWESF